MALNSEQTRKNALYRKQALHNRNFVFFNDKLLLAIRHTFSRFVIAMIVLSGTVSVVDAQFSRSSDSTASKEAWHLTADKIKYDQDLDQYVAEGHVVISKQNLKLTADRVSFNQKTMQAFAEGNVRMTTGTDVVTGSHLEMDLDSEVGTIYDSTLFIKANHFYLRGAKIEKVGKETYTAKQVSVTTCSGPLPDWKITGKDLKVTVEGYGTLKHAALWARRMPVGYTPFFFFPAKKKRQSGFLTPEFGSSDRKGSEYIQPYFWAIDESSDATFYAHYLEKRGLKYGAEYRYVLDEESKGSVMFDFLDDRQVDDGENDSSRKYGYEDDNVLRPNSDRYWFRMKVDQPLPHDFDAKLDLDVVSDQDYLHDFKRGYTAFSETNTYFEKEFGRSLDDYDDSIRVNRLNVSRIWPQFSLNTELRWYDNVVKRRQQDDDTTLQMLPVIKFDASRQQLMDTPFFYNLESEYKYYYRPDVEPLFIRGQILDLHPRIFLPLRYQNYLTIEPSVGFRETLWYTDDNDVGVSSAGFEWEDEDQFRHREIYDLKLDLSTDLHKVYRIKKPAVDKIKHIIKPQIIYNYIPRVDQDEYPRFESIEEKDNGDILIDDNLSQIDRIEDRNRITYAIANSFTAKTKKLKNGSKPADNESTVPFDYSYRQFAWFKLEQSYIFDESDVDDDEPFSEIFAELEFYPTSHVSLAADAAWDPYENDFASRNFAVKLTDDKGDSLLVEHRYFRNFDISEVETIETESGATITIADSDTDTSEDTESIYVNLHCILTGRLSGYGEYERNILDDETILTRIGFLYKSQCWSLDVNFTDEAEDTKIGFMITLHGLGEIGSEFTPEF